LSSCDFFRAAGILHFCSPLSSVHRVFVLIVRGVDLKLLVLRASLFFRAKQALDMREASLESRMMCK